MAAEDVVTVKLPADDEGNFAITGNGILGTGAERTLEITFSDGVSQLTNIATFTLSATDDGIFEAPHKITFTGTALNNVFVVSTAITLNDDDHELELMASETEIAEDGGKKKVTVTATLTKGTRATNINIPVTVSTSRFYTLSESSFNVEIEAQKTMGTGSFEITPANNVTYDGSQKITIDVGTTTLAFKGPVTIALNDDEKLPDLKLSASPDKISEGGGGRRVTVTASLEGGVTLSTSTRVAVSIAPSSGQYSLSQSAMSITIPANRTSGTGRVTITPVSDSEFELPEPIKISASATLVPGDSDSDVKAMTTVTLIDDDHTVTLSASPSTIKDADPVADDSQPTEVTVTATLTSPAAVEETVLVKVPEAPGATPEYTVVNVNDGTAFDVDADVLTITIGPGESTGSAKISVMPDNIFATNNPAYNPSVDIELTAAAALSTKLTVVDAKVLPGLMLTVDMAMITEENENDDPPSPHTPALTVTAALDLMDSKAGTLGADLDVTVKVPVVTAAYDISVDDVAAGADGAEFMITILANGTTANNTDTITIAPTADGIFEAHRDITLTGEATIGADKVSATAKIQLRDNDHELTLSASPDMLTEDGGKKKVTVTAEITSTRAQDINIPVTISTSPSFYTLSESSFNVEIEAQKTMGTASFEITPTDNATYDGSQEITVTLGSGSNLVLRDDFTITLTDDEELPTLKLSAVPDMVAEGGGGQRLTVTASLEDGVVLPTATTVSVEVEENADQYSRSTAMLSIVIPANQRSGTGSVTITPVSDFKFEKPVSIVLEGSATLVEGMDSTKQTAMTTVTLIDDDHTVTLSASPSTIKDADPVADDSQPTEVTVTATLTSPAAVEETVLVKVPEAPGATPEYTVVNVNDGTAFDVDADVLTITIGPGESTGSAKISVMPDNIFATNNPAYNPSVDIELTAAAALSTKLTVVDAKVLPGLMLTVDMAMITEENENDDPPSPHTPALTVTAALDLMDSKAGTLGADLDVTVKVPVVTAAYDISVDDVAAGADGAEFMITILANGTTANNTDTITIAPTADGIFEAHRDITLTGEATIGADKVSATAKIQLRDNDHELTLSASPDMLTEDGGKKKVTVTAEITSTRAQDINIPVTISTSPSFYTLSESSFNVEIEAQKTMGTASFEITPTDNATYDGSQEITVTLGSGSNLVLRDDFTITLTDDEELPTLKLSAVPDMVAEGGGGQRLTVTASLEDGVVLPTATTVSVEVEENADQYSRSTAMLSIVIPANQRSGTGSVTITPVSDFKFEKPVSIVLEGSATLVEGMDSTKQTAMTTVTLIDDDHTVTLSASPSTIKDADPVADDSQPTEVTVTATLTSPAAVEETVLVKVPEAPGATPEYTVVNVNDGTAFDVDADVLTITIGPGESTGSAKISVMPDNIFATNNPAYNPSVDIELTAAAALSTKLTVVDAKVLPGLMLTVDMAMITEENENDDPPSPHTPALTVTAALDLMDSKAGTLGADLDVTVKVPVVTAAYDISVDDVAAGADGAEFMITILANGTTANNTDTITIAPTADGIFEAHRDITLTGEATIGADKVSATAKIQLRDNDHELTLSASPDMLTEDGGKKSVEITATVTSAPASDIEIPLTVSTSRFYTLSTNLFNVEIDARGHLR